MRNSAVQISFLDIYNGVSESIGEQKPELIRLLEEHIDFDRLTFVLDSRKSLRTASAKADVFLAGIVQLVGVLLADALNKQECIKSVRRLIAV